MRILMIIAALFMFLPGQSAKANGPVVEYELGVVEDQFRRDKTVVLLFHDYWCQACQRQAEIISALRSTNFRFNDMVFINVDWSSGGYLPVIDDFGVTDVSTMIIADRDGEKARMVRVTYEDAIAGFLQLGLDW